MKWSNSTSANAFFYFLYKNEIRTIPNSVSIGLSLMVVVAGAFLQHLETNSLIIAEVGQFSQKNLQEIRR